MRKPRRTVLNLLPLESRLTPSASVRFAGGTLTVTGDNTANTIAITGQAGSVNVKVNGVSSGTYAVTGAINVTTGNSKDVVNVTINVGKSLQGNLTINTGNSDDAVNLNSSGGGFATLAGNLTVNTGLGDDTVAIATTDAKTPVDTSVAVQGFTNCDGGIGFDTFLAGFNKAADATFAGTTVLNRFNNFLSDGKAPNSTHFAGVYVFNSSSEGALATVWGPNNTRFYSSATVVTGSGDDLVEAVFGCEFDGNVLFNVGAGNNSSLNFGNNNFNGDFTFLAAGGNDFIANGEPHAGSVYLYLGDGDNTVFDSSTVNGSYTVLAGNGADDLSNFSAAVAGNATFNLGNGTNTLVIDGSVNQITGPVNYTGGGGVDSVTIMGTNAFALRVNLGSGDDFFTYGPTASVGSAYIDFGPGTDTFTDNGVFVTWNQTLLNLP